MSARLITKPYRVEPSRAELGTSQKKQNCGKNNEKAVKRKAPSPDSGSNEGNTSAEEQNKNSTGVKKGGKERKGKKKKKKKKKKGNNPP
uniref:Uncharacterized protein n=1 Tax=Oryza rufipogon TaxID=4529 RepID=A0A0E0NVK0_ORYRU